MFNESIGREQHVGRGSTVTEANVLLAVHEDEMQGDISAQHGAIAQLHHQQLGAWLGGAQDADAQVRLCNREGGLNECTRGCVCGEGGEGAWWMCKPQACAVLYTGPKRHQHAFCRPNIIR